ncbi:MAG: tail fiber domain-containing protein [Rhodothermales bacterium]
MRRHTLLLTAFLLLLTVAKAAAQTKAMEIKDNSGTSLFQINEDASLFALGTFGIGTIPATGAGTWLMWYPRKGAFRAGYVSSYQWDDAYIGDYSTAFGHNTMAADLGSSAIGYNAVAAGDFATALGRGFANAESATATGQGVAVGTHSTATGSGRANGDYSTAMGGWGQANGDYSTAMGNGQADGDYSTAVGKGQASGNYSTAMGNGRATGHNATAMGSGRASGDMSIASGFNTRASGKYSMAMGYFTTAQAYASLVLGRYNVVSGDSLSWMSTDPLLVVGNGRDEHNPSNAFTLLKNGNLTIAGTLTENSDRRLKTDITPLHDAGNALARLQPVRYHFRKGTNRPEGVQIGLIAQEVQEVFPELVIEGADGYLSVSYAKLSAVLVQALNEQQAQLEAKAAAVEALQNELAAVNERLARLESASTAER